LYQNGKNDFFKFPGDNPLAFPGGLNALALLMKLDGMTIEVRHHLSEPNDSAFAYLDAMTVEDWITEQRKAWDAAHPKPVDPAEDPNIAVGMSPETAEVFVTSVRSAFSLEPGDISFFFLLYYAATAGGYSSLVDVSGGTGAAEATRFTLGTQSLVAKLCDEIKDEAQSNIMLGARASKIAYDEAGATITLSDGRVLRCKRVIVAMAPPTSVHQLAYEPKFETGSAAAKDRAALCQAMSGTLGATIKGFVKFDRAFWRERGLMGYLLSSGTPIEEHPLDWTLDNVWVDPTGIEPDRYSLMTFIVGDAAKYWSKRDPKERAEAVIRHLQLVYRFDDGALLNPADRASNYVEENWPTQIQNGLGAPDAMMPPGALTKYGHALRAPIGPIHWAGAESSTEWCGYMNGAIESGFRAASEAMRALQAAGKAGAAGGTPPDDKPPRPTTPPSIARRQAA
jgi:hypothetical protein